jgi:ATP-dependent Lon protease
VGVEYILETEMASNLELKAYSLSVIKSLKELIQLNPLHKEELALIVSQSDLTDPGRLADFAAALTTSSGEELQEILATVSVRERLDKVLVLLNREINISRLQTQIHKQIEEKLTNQQREFFLREQLKAIKKELGLEKEGKEAEVERFEQRLKEIKLSEEARERVKDEMDKLRLLDQSSPEFNVSRTYLDWLTCLPWGVFTKDSYDLKAAAKILDHDHFGLEDVKQRILEFLAVGIMKGNISGSILCFVGPPGVGKTSIGQSIARSIGRNFYRFSVGGVQDEAEIKGHRRTYIGALPGKFIQVMRVCKSANPVIMLDEIDKIGASYHGDPASALLEVLDPSQNKDFLDHYLDVRFDLSNAFFICTANQLDTIPRPLLDRMEVIKLAGYIQEEKIQIAKRFLIPKQAELHGMKANQFAMTAAAIRKVINGYAREPGVRSLENGIKKIMRKGVREIVDGKKKKISVDAGDIEPLLGRPFFTDDRRRKEAEPGVVMGLAWTSMGGDTLYIEASHVETGTPGLKQTGQLGSVMVESSEIAYTFIRSFMNGSEKAREFFKKNFIHLHVPAGATPKDGPSAGITMAMAIYSLAVDQPVKPGMAMTGELTLTGRVMPIGGVKEKVMAAKRALVTNLIFPEENRKDFEELPATVRRGVKPWFVREFRDVIKICMANPGRRMSDKRR